MRMSSEDSGSTVPSSDDKLATSLLGLVEALSRLEHNLEKQPPPPVAENASENAPESDTEQAEKAEQIHQEIEAALTDLNGLRTILKAQQSNA